MYISWTKGLSEEDKKTFYLQVSAAHPVLRKLVKTFEEDLQQSRKRQLVSSNYEASSWPYQQADFVGEQRTYNRVIELISNLISEV